MAMMNYRRKGTREDGVAAPPSTDRWSADPSDAGTGLGALIEKHLLVSPDTASDLIDFGSVYVGGRVERDPSRQIAEGREIVVNWPWGGTVRFYEINPDRILYEDEYLLAYDKESGIPSQQTPADGYNNLFAALNRFLQKERRKNPYAALHHRLDRETSGVIVFALDGSVNKSLGHSFESRRVRKDYLAWAEGNPQWDRCTASEDITRIGGRYAACPRGSGKRAETLLGVLHRADDRSLIWARPMTGRTHQVRLHLAAQGHPVIGDRLYGKIKAERLYLHAYRLKLLHPRFNSNLVLTAPVPDDWPAPREVPIPD